MIIDEKVQAAFAEYEKPLGFLQSSFILAGLAVGFNCLIDPVYGKVVEVYKDNKSSRIICIEGDSPAQAVKDVAAGVRL
jgi:hypothetical protein